MIFELHESVNKLPKATMNMVWYLWELHGKKQSTATFVLTFQENTQTIQVAGTDQTYTVELPSGVTGTVTIRCDGITAAMTFDDT